MAVRSRLITAPGPSEALVDFGAEDHHFDVDFSREKSMFTFNPGGFLRRRGH